MNFVKIRGNIFGSLLAIFFIVGIYSCADDSTNSVTPTTLTTLTKSNFRPDSLAGFLYYSFESDTTIAVSDKATDKWDIKLAYLKGGGATRQIDVFLNSGTVNSAGQTKGIVVNSAFDQLATAPADAQFRTDDTTVAGRIVSIDVVGGGMFNYDGAPNHTISPNPAKTLVLKTKSGKYVKLAFISIYQNNPQPPLITSPIGYYTFRYVKSTTTTLK